MMRVRVKTREYLSFSLNLLRYNKRITAADIFLNAIIFSEQAAVAFFVRQALNGLEGAAGRALEAAWPCLVGLLIVSVLRVAAIMGCAALDALRSFYYQNRTRLNLLRRLLRRPDVTQVVGNSNQLFEVLDDDVPSCTFPAELLTEVTGYAIYTLIALSMLLAIDWRLTLFIFVPLSFAIYGVQRLSERLKERRRTNRAAHDQASAFIGDIADAALSVKAAGAREAVLSRYDAINADRRAAILGDVFFGERVSALLQGAVCVGSAVMMLVAARLMAGDSFGLGDFSLFIAHLGTLADCVNRVVELVYESRKAEVSYERILSALQDERADALLEEAGVSLKETQSPPPPPARPEPLASLEIRQLSFAYAGGGGFRDVSFSVRPGELVAVAGGMASGKSTLLSVLMGLMPAGGGAILWNGEPIKTGSNRMAGAPQHSGFFSTDLQTNLLLGQRIPSAALGEALEIACLDKAVEAMPGGLFTPVGGRGDQLSGGQRQRLALARLLARTPGVSVIDDCVSALDQDTQREILRRLTRFLKRTGRAAIIATNAQPILESADRIVLMENNRVAAVGDYRELESTQPLLAGVVEG